MRRARRCRYGASVCEARVARAGGRVAAQHAPWRLLARVSRSKKLPHIADVRLRRVPRRHVRCPLVQDELCTGYQLAVRLDGLRPDLIELALAIARRENFAAQRGVYVAVLGPNYETRAEYRCFRRIGGDVVGMSTVPEVLAAARCGMKVLGLSVVTNVAKPDALTATSGQAVIDAAALNEDKLRSIVLGVLTRDAAKA